ncbi:hypothetical protein [Latilactobacillus curvatus]|uniref:hypothetical protein n=1 Tax=Latilactobacillus curvatus TaxID=28038 RepID=UPI00223B8555|nr:hypothetical protein [Latilactobacillus curvatus]MCS8616361.1 hypothetical protein [Latilactobacillus curvatus]
MLKFSSKLWQQHHRGLLPKSHLVVLDGLPVTKAHDGNYEIDEYTTADGQKWELYPIYEEDCVDDISLFDKEVTS